MSKLKVHNRTKIFIDGVPAVDIARKNGIPKNMLYFRLSKGWSLERACTYKRLKGKELALKLGVDIAKIYSLHQNKGYSWEDLEDMAYGRKENTIRQERD